MEEGNDTTENPMDREGGSPAALQIQSGILPSTEFVKVEKNPFAWTSFAAKHG